MSKQEIQTDGLREKYADKLYTIGVNIEIDDSTTERKEYLFKKPSTFSYDRYIKTMSNSATKASKDFVLDNVVDEQCDQLRADLEEYPAMAVTFSDKLFAMLGLGKDVDVKKF